VSSSTRPSCSAPRPGVMTLPNRLQSLRARPGRDHRDDGPSHHGIFRLTFLRACGLTLAQPAIRRTCDCYIPHRRETRSVCDPIPKGRPAKARPTAADPPVGEWKCCGGQGGTAAARQLVPSRWKPPPCRNEGLPLTVVNSRYIKRSIPARSGPASPAVLTSKTRRRLVRVGVAKSRPLGSR